MNVWISCLTAALEDAEKDFIYIDNVEMWGQTWPNTACGFGGMAGQAFTTAPTVIIESEGRFKVYHNGRFAYELNRPTHEFYVDRQGRCLLGANETWRVRYRS